MASRKCLAVTAMRKVAAIPNSVPKHPPDEKRVPMVLCNAGYYGTLAAMRSLGRIGVPIVTVDTGILSPGGYSRLPIGRNGFSRLAAMGLAGPFMPRATPFLMRWRSAAKSSALCLTCTNQISTR